LRIYEDIPTGVMHLYSNDASVMHTRKYLCIDLAQ